MDRKVNILDSLFCLIFCILFSVLYMDKIPTWLAVLGSGIVGIFTAVIVQVFVVPRQRGKILVGDLKVENKF